MQKYHYLAVTDKGFEYSNWVFAHSRYQFWVIMAEEISRLSKVNGLVESVKLIKVTD
jgi:hypothetical protein